MASPAPLLLLHGIWDTGADMLPLLGYLEKELQTEGQALSFSPNDGSASVEQLSAQVEQAAEKLLSRTGAERLRLVGFSMGAMVGRHFVQARGGYRMTSHFAALSGPHGGTIWGHLWPKKAAREMSTGSPLLRSLNDAEDPWPGTRVLSLWTPFDLMIMPPNSSRLAHAEANERLPVALHRLMVSDKRVWRRVADFFGTPPLAPAPSTVGAT